MYYLHHVEWDGEKEVRFTGDIGQAVKMQNRTEGYKFLDALKAQGTDVVRFWFTRVPINNMLGWVAMGMSAQELEDYIANYDKAYK